MTYLLAIDQGTSSTRAMIYTISGELKHASQYSLTQYYPESGWVEHCPEEIWSKTLTAIKDVLQMVGPESIFACGITNQRETTLLWDKQTGKCIYRAIVWQDRRTQTFCNSLKDSEDLIKAKTGLLLDSYFSASKLHWLLDNVPEAKTLAANNRLAFGTIDSFLIWRLTRGRAHRTDITNASRTLLFNIIEKKWDEELLNLFNISFSILPEVVASDAEFGCIDSSFFGVPIPITGVAGDQQAAMIGQRCFAKGMIKATYGTGGFLMANIGARPFFSNHRLLTTVAYEMKGETAYALEGSLYHAGTTIKWLRDEMHVIKTADDSECLAQSLDSNEGVYLVPAFTGLGAPYWSSNAGAAIVGLSRMSTPAHFARAALESVCYLTREILQCMREDSGMNFSLVRVDGGMAANGWFLQFLANQCQLTVQKPKDIETTAQGAAMLAAVGCGAITSIESLDNSWHSAETYSAKENDNIHEEEFAGWKKAVAMICT